MTPQNLEESLMSARVLVCAGTGGVGKTTIAASLGIQAALRGRRTLVLTIDPARRLANALGLDDFSAEPTPVAFPEFEEKAASSTEFRLDAMMLDPKPTFDRLVDQLSADEAGKQRILENRYYQHLSEALAGNAEYAAMLQVEEHLESGAYDLLIVDTPPSNHALDFLRAPHRLREFLEGRFVRTLARPSRSIGRFSVRLMGRSLKAVLNIIERIGGRGFIEDLTEFLEAVAELADGFLLRATRVERILLGSDTHFLLVCGARAGTEFGAREFMRELEAFEVRIAAVIANRMPPWPLADPPSDWTTAKLRSELEADLNRLETACHRGDARTRTQVSSRRADVLTCLTDAAQQAEEAGEAQKTLQSHAARLGVPCIGVPEFADDSDRVGGLRTIGEHLIGSSSIQPSGVRM